MNKNAVLRERTAILYGLLPLLVLSDSFSVGIVLGISFLFSYITATVFQLFEKEHKPKLKSALILFFVISICLSLILSITRIINPFLFELVFLKICIIPLVPVLFKVQFGKNQKDHEWGLRELLYGFVFSLIIVFTGFIREFLVSFSLASIFQNDAKAFPMLPIFNQPAGAFLLLGLAACLARYIQQKKGKANE